VTAPAPLLLSKRAAAALLGVGRGGTLEQLIRDGHLRTVVIAGRVRIAREEVERIAREGTGRPASPRPARTPRPAVSAGDAIRAL